MGMEAKSHESLCESADGVQDEGGGVSPSSTSPARIGRVNDVHQQMVEALLVDCALTNRALADRFGYSEVQVSRIRNSPAFQVRLDERRREISEGRDGKLKELHDSHLEIALLANKKTLERLQGDKVSENFILRAGDTANRALSQPQKETAGKTDLTNHIAELAKNLEAVLPKPDGTVGDDETAA
jgi:hypothetical protein